MCHYYDARMTTKTIMGKWNIGEIFSLFGSSESEEQFDLHKLEMVLLTWLVRNNECGDVTQSGLGRPLSQPQNLDTVSWSSGRKIIVIFF